mgnify:CR=1 FL=1
MEPAHRAVRLRELVLSGAAVYPVWTPAEYGFPLGGSGTAAVRGGILAAVYILLARQLPYKGEYNIGPRQLFSAFFIGILFMVQAAVLDNARAEQTPLSLTVTILIGQFYFITLLYFSE